MYYRRIAILMVKCVRHTRLMESLSLREHGQSLSEASRLAGAGAGTGGSDHWEADILESGTSVF